MKPYNSLSRLGKARRLRELALNALKNFDFEVTNVQLLGLLTNAIFRVKTAENRSYVIRVCVPWWRTREDRLMEIAWLRALSSEPTIGAPIPLSSRDGNYVIEARANGIPEPRDCIVMSMLPGTLLGNNLTEDNLFKMGVLFARLHHFSSSYTPPPLLNKRRMDNVFARDEPVVLFDNSIQSTFTSRTQDVLKETWENVDKAFTALYSNPAGLRVIHNDLHHENIKVYKGRLYPFDFEDTILGYPVQDIAMALQDLMVDVPPNAFEPFQSCFRQGYETLLPWPEQISGQIDTFRAGRMFWVANYVVKYENEYLAEFIDQLTKVFDQYLTSGLIRRI